MEKFTTHRGTCAPLFEPNIDTDQIVPKKFLLSTKRTGYAIALFNSQRFSEDGAVKEGFVLNKPEFQDASILIAGENFGCGSSREHAPWAIHEYGFRVILAPSFADIFYNNCLNTGLLPIVLETEDVKRLADSVVSNPEYTLDISLPEQTVSSSDGFRRAFEIDPFAKHNLLNGLDRIDLTLTLENEISKHEENRISFLSK